MRRNLIHLLFFVAGFICASLIFIFFNNTGRYIPIDTKYSDVYMSILDTKTGIIYTEVKDRSSDKMYHLKVDLTNSVKEKK
ncbi:hypothetical protein GCM10023210_28750 [Chryseobacterium ginsengisoli]|uniref:Uncharacterized protein n=1 Tax=Chryseobacterium ginsengisoli TaxID=363853 RepID=A0ABP9MIW3_9FLAO